MTDPDYLLNARDKIGTAVQTLATAPAPLRQRLNDAYRDIGVVFPDRLPEPLAQELRSIQEAYRAGALSDEEAGRLAERIVLLYDELWEEVCRSGADPLLTLGE